MKETIYNLLAQQGDMTWQQITMHILVSAVIGLFIFISYVISHKGTIYSKKFGVTLIVLTVMTGTVMTVIGNNIALSLGMVGALSIVRFRTAIKDSRDTVYIFWTIIVGICCGVGDYLVAAVGSSAIFLIFLIMGAIRSDNRMLLIIRAKRSRCENIESQVFRYFGTGAVPSTPVPKSTVRMSSGMSWNTLLLNTTIRPSSTTAPLPPFAPCGNSALPTTTAGRKSMTMCTPAFWSAVTAAVPCLP